MLTPLRMAPSRLSVGSGCIASPAPGRRAGHSAGGAAGGVGEETPWLACGIVTWV